MSGLAGVSAVGALIGIQEVDTATDREAKGKKRGRELLGELDQLRIALLTGEITQDQLMRLATMVQRQRENVDSPGLTQILDDIELRVRVELAKYGF